MRNSNRFVVAAVAAAGLVAAGTGTASANPPARSYQSPVVEWVAPVVHALAGSNSAVVHAKYQCSGGNAGTHLYIGVKQGPLVNTTNHSTSEFSDTFYSTNWNSDGPGLSLICDGHDHNKRFVVKPDPYFAMQHPNAPALHSGRALVQFCLFDSTGSEESGFAFDYSMKKVVTNR